MTLINAETRSKILVVLIITGCVGASILLGVAIFELPWNSGSGHEKHLKLYNYSSLTIAQIENDTEALQKLEKAHKNLPMNYTEMVETLLKIYPVIDGHNDLPWNLRNLLQNDLRKFNFTDDLTKVEPWASYNESHTDLVRLQKGQVGAQFWVAYTNCDGQGKDAVVQVLEQIDLIHRLVEEYPEHLRFCRDVKCILETSFNRKNCGRIASLIGVEGGHLIMSSPGVLRQFYNLGVRYLTLTHTCNLPWADASPVDDPSSGVVGVNGGLSQFGLELIDELNRLGMMVDLSHVSEATMIAALKRSRAPVIFSHSGAKAICNVHRNVGDEVLKLLKANGGVIMINFYTEFIYCDTETPRLATIMDVVSHIEHIRDLIGIDHIGLGGDFDGVDSVPKGLEDVSKYPDLFEILVQRGWLLTDLRKISFTNILRVFESVENVKKQLAEQTENKLVPMQSIISLEELNSKTEGKASNCLSSRSLPMLLDKQNKKKGKGVDTTKVLADHQSSGEESKEKVEYEITTSTTTATTLPTTTIPIELETDFDTTLMPETIIENFTTAPPYYPID